MEYKIEERYVVMPKIHMSNRVTYAFFSLSDYIENK